MRVPIYQRQENVEAMQAAQISPLMPTGDYGANAAGVMKSIVDRIQKLQNDTEDARTLELFNKFKTDSQVYHEDPDKGIYNTRLGYNAQGVYNETDQWLRKTGEEYVKGLKSERAKTNFRNMARDYILQRGKQNSQFEANQIKKYRNEQADATITNQLNFIEQNWNKAEAVNYARENINQALELKMRGSGQEAFKAAHDEIENQIGIVRIRQAYLKNPMLALRMLEDPDIKLLPKTRSQLTKQAVDKTEIYEISATARTYAKNYGLENAVSVHDNLIKNYGPDKGEKIFNHWEYLLRIKDTQNNAVRGIEYRDQLERQHDLLRKINRGYVPDEEEIKKGNYDVQFESQMLNYIKAVKNDEERKQQLQKEIELKEGSLRLDFDTWNGKTYSNDDLILGVVNGKFSKEAADRNRAERTRQENAKLKSDAENEKLRQEQIKQEKENSLKDLAADYANLYNSKTKGEGLAAINALLKKGYSHDDIKIITNEYNRLIGINEQIETDSEAVLKEVKANNANNFELRIANGDNVTKNEVLAALNDNIIFREDYDRIINKINQKQNLERQAQQSIFDNDMQNKADEIYEKYNLDSTDINDTEYDKRLEAAYKEIRALPNEQRNKIMEFFRQRETQTRTIRTEKTRSETKIQLNNYLNLTDEYIKNLKPVPEDILRKAERDNSLNAEQINSLRNSNVSISKSEGIERLIRENPSKYGLSENYTPRELEIAIMRNMGTSDEDRERNVAYLYERMLNGQGTRAEIEAFLAAKKILAEDAERLRNVPVQLQSDRNKLLSNKLRELTSIVNGFKTTNQALKNELRQLIINAFQENTAGLSPTDKNFAKDLSDIVKEIEENVGKYFAEKGYRITDWHFFRPDTLTPKGILLEDINKAADISEIPQQMYFENTSGDAMFLDSNGESGEWNGASRFLPKNEELKTESDDIDPYEAEIPSEFYEPFYPSGKRTTKNENKVNFTQSILGGEYRMSSSFNPKPTKLRSGRGHRAEDYAVPEGTPIKTGINSSYWIVKKVGENDTAGKFVTVETRLDSGDIFEVTTAHMSSTDVNVGDRIASGDIVGKSGNTGNSTGPHVHISTKINGVPVPPSSINLSGDITQSQNPTEKNEQEKRAIFDEVMGLSFDALFDNNDNFYYFGIPYGGY